MINKLASRKFWLVILILFGSTALFLLNKIIADQWISITGWIISVYIGGNVIQNVGNSLSQNYCQKNNGNNIKEVP